MVDTPAPVPSIKVTLADLEVSNPKLHKNILRFCSGLDPREFPDAIKITRGRYNTVSGLTKIYEKLLEKKKDKQAKKRLKEAEKMLFSISASTAGKPRELIGPTREERKEPLAKVARRFFDVLDTENEKLTKLKKLLDGSKFDELRDLIKQDPQTAYLLTLIIEENGRSKFFGELTEEYEIAENATDVLWECAALGLDLSPALTKLSWFADGGANISKELELFCSSILMQYGEAQTYVALSQRDEKRIVDLMRANLYLSIGATVALGYVISNQAVRDGLLVDDSPDSAVLEVDTKSVEIALSLLTGQFTNASFWGEIPYHIVRYGVLGLGYAKRHGLNSEEVDTILKEATEFFHAKKKTRDYAAWSLGKKMDESDVEELDGFSERLFDKDADPTDVTDTWVYDAAEREKSFFDKFRW